MTAVAGDVAGNAAEVANGALADVVSEVCIIRAAETWSIMVALGTAKEVLRSTISRGLAATAPPRTINPGGKVLVVENSAVGLKSVRLHLFCQ